MDLTVPPADLLPGDRLVQPDQEELWPQVDSVGDTVQDDWLGDAVQVHIVGQADPRVFAVQSGLAIRRPDDAAPPPDPTPEPEPATLPSGEPNLAVAPPREPAP